MNYKRIIKSRKLRLKILRMLSWIPDKLMLKIQYRIKFGRKLDLKNPTRFTEKIQWYKLYYKNPDMVRCVDKADVRDYLSRKGFEKYLLQCYGVYENAENIDFENLPQSFVLKDTLGGGGNSVIVVKNKKEINKDEVLVTLKRWCCQRIIRDVGREWPYYSGKRHRILIEEYLNAENEHGLIDYKFYCFNGECKYVNVIFDRLLGQNAKIFYLTRDYVNTGVYHPEEGKIIADELPPKPDNYNEMVFAAEQLSKDFPMVRVDLYSYKGAVCFGELTFFDASGYLAFEPDSFDYVLGECFVLPEKMK